MNTNRHCDGLNVIMNACLLCVGRAKEFEFDLNNGFPPFSTWVASRRWIIWISQTLFHLGCVSNLGYFCSPNPYPPDRTVARRYFDTLRSHWPSWLLELTRPKWHKIAQNDISTRSHSCRPVV